MSKTHTSFIDILDYHFSYAFMMVHVCKFSNLYEELSLNYKNAYITKKYKFHLDYWSRSYPTRLICTLLADTTDVFKLLCLVVVWARRRNHSIVLIEVWFKEEDVFPLAPDT